MDMNYIHDKLNGLSFWLVMEKILQRKPWKLNPWDLAAALNTIRSFPGLFGFMTPKCGRQLKIIIFPKMASFKTLSDSFCGCLHDL
ncbi:unnamed protein product [Allacma fusca]|uniref:Uncharacterized protein n=1 Tax=Allacma fusca TaxID=39272 RepID=A0A8J2JFC7_9HEXA|nr:unnamed protein product [Allacma fusca]